MRVGLLRELKEAGLDALEVYYRSFDPPTVAAVAEVASELALVPTGGSDYHGDFGPYAESHARLWVPPEVETKLVERLSNLSASAPS